MPNMKDPLLSRIRNAAETNVPELSTSIINPKQGVQRSAWLKPTLAIATTFLLVSGVVVWQTPKAHIYTKNAASYGPHDTMGTPNETFTPDWLLPWFGSEGIAYELKTPGDFDTRLAILEVSLPKGRSDLRRFDLEGYGHWLYSDATFQDYVTLPGELPSEQTVRTWANRLFIDGGFSGDLSTMKITSDSLVITANCELLLDGRPSGIGYSASWTKGGHLINAEGWITTIVRHYNVPVMSPREATGNIQWRDVVGIGSFNDYQWDGASDPQVQDLYTTTKETSNGPLREYEVRHYTITASSPNLAMTRNKLNAWIVPSYLLASGKTIIKNQPAVNSEVLDRLTSDR